MDDKVLLQIAKDAILENFGEVKIDKEELLRNYPYLANEGAVFVTLNQNGALRGCIGSLVAHRSLLEDIIHNAKAAAFDDPRFFPLSKSEFENIDLELSLLSAPKIVEYEDIEDLKSKIEIGVDGIILKKGYNQATFLPQVWEELSSFEQFFAHLCKKAGLNPNCLQLHPEIYKYQVKKIR